MAENADSFYLAAKDAASAEREERLAKAKRKLKSYRAKQAKSSSTTGSIDLISRPTSAASGSTKIQHRQSTSRSGILNPIASTSKGVSVANHSKKLSNSRGSRNSFTHSHTRSKASISISVSAPTPSLKERNSINFSSPPPNTTSELGLPPSDNPYSVSYKPNRNSWSSQLSAQTSSPLRDDASTSTSTPIKRLSNSLDPRTAFSISPIPSPSTTPYPLPTAESKAHNRKSSRHSRRISVTNFRESMEIISGQGNYSGVLTPIVGSFAPLPSSTLTNQHDVSPFRSPSPTWNDPIKVLEALKERGRLETEAENDQKRTRLGALEALEGRLSAPSQIIDLGNEEEGQLLHAPPSPGYTTTSAPSSPTPVFSPMYGLGLVGGATPISVKRNSWNALGPVTSAGAKGALDLGMLIEEEEEEEEEETDAVTALTSPPRKRRSSNKPRPSSLLLVSSIDSSSIPISSPIEEPPLSATFLARPMRLSMSLSASSPSSFGVTPSTSTSTFQERPAAPLRSLTLGSAPLSSSAPLSRESSHEGLSPNERRQMLLNSSNNSSPAAAQPRGLRPLSIGSFPISSSSSSSATSPNSIDQFKPQRSPMQIRTSLPPSQYNNNNNNNPTSASSSPRHPIIPKRSSISYRTSPIPSLASSEGPLSASAQAARRPWRTSVSGTSISSTSSSGPASNSNSISQQSGFGYSNSAGFNGFNGGFGDLQVDEEMEESQLEEERRDSLIVGNVEPFGATLAEVEILNSTISSLQSQLTLLNLTISNQTSQHSTQMEEFEKRAGEEAKGMRIRISELDKSIEEISVVRRFEVEGLSREVEQAKEAMDDLIEERDSLREDVDGWRNRCATLEKVVKKDKEDEALSKAQVKLIGEMRDQIYNLVAALDRERSKNEENKISIEDLSTQLYEERFSHEETKQVVERLLVERAASPPSSEETDEEEAAIGSRGETIQDNQISIDPTTSTTISPINNHRQYPFKTDSSDTSSSMISARSVGRSLSGNTTEATSVGTDSEDNLSTNNLNSKTSSPTNSIYSNSFPTSHDNDFANAVAIGGLQTLDEEEEEVENELETKFVKTPISIESVLEKKVEVIQEVAAPPSIPIEVKVIEEEKVLIPLAVTIPDSREERIRLGSGSTGSTEESEAMPMTPSKEAINSHHNRSDSFVRHWSFPKGSVSSVRISEDDDHSFFDLNRHTSLPALPIPESILPPFLCADLMVDEEQFASLAPPPTRAPFPSPPTSSINRFSNSQLRSPTQERLSPQQGVRSKSSNSNSNNNQNRVGPPPPPPLSMSASTSSQINNRISQPLSPSTLQHQSAFGGSSVSSNGSFSINSPSRLVRLSQMSLTNIVSSLGGWSPSSSISAMANAVSNNGNSNNTKLSMSVSTREDEEERMFMVADAAESSSNTGYIVQHKTPSSLAYESRLPKKFIRHDQQPRPYSSRLSVLDFRPVCCTENTPVFTL